MADKRSWTFKLGLKRSDGTPVPDHWRPDRNSSPDKMYDNFIPNAVDKKDEIEEKKFREKIPAPRPEEYFYIKPGNFIADCKILASKVSEDDPVLSHVQNAKELVGIIERIDFEIRYMLMVKEQQMDTLKDNKLLAKYLAQYEKSKQAFDGLKHYSEEGAPQ